MVVPGLSPPEECRGHVLLWVSERMFVPGYSEHEAANNSDNAVQLLSTLSCTSHCDQFLTCIFPSGVLQQLREVRTSNSIFLVRKQASCGCRSRTVGGDARAGTPCVLSSPLATDDRVFSAWSPPPPLLLHYTLGSQGWVCLVTNKSLVPMQARPVGDAQPVFMQRIKD